MAVAPADAVCSASRLWGVAGVHVAGHGRRGPARRRRLDACWAGRSRPAARPVLAVTRSKAARVSGLHRSRRARRVERGAVALTDPHSFTDPQILRSREVIPQFRERFISRRAVVRMVTGRCTNLDSPGTTPPPRPRLADLSQRPDTLEEHRVAKAHRVRPRLQVEFLEAREVPDGSPTETFDSLTPPALPAGWGSWSNDSSLIFATASDQGVGGSNALTSSVASRTSGLTWFGTTVSGDTGAAVSLKADSLVPAFAFARGSNLNSATPSYLAAVVTRGLHVELRQVVNGTTTVLGSITSPGSAYLSGRWVRASLVPTGNSVSVQVTRADSGQFLSANGIWQTAATSAITAATTIPPTIGFVGVGRAVAYSGPVYLDDFTVLTPTIVGVKSRSIPRRLAAHRAVGRRGLATRTVRSESAQHSPSAPRMATPRPAAQRRRHARGPTPICRPTSMHPSRSMPTASSRRVSSCAERISTLRIRRITPPRLVAAST